MCNNCRSERTTETRARTERFRIKLNNMNGNKMKSAVIDKD